MESRRDHRQARYGQERIGETAMSTDMISRGRYVDGQDDTTLGAHRGMVKEALWVVVGGDQLTTPRQDTEEKRREQKTLRYLSQNDAKRTFMMIREQVQLRRAPQRVPFNYKYE